MGKSWFEDAILEEITELVAVFKSHSGRPFEPLVPLTLAVSNVICALVFGQRFKHTDVKFQKLCTLIGDNIRLLAALFPVQLFPFLKRIPFGKMTRSWLQALKNIDAVQTFIRGLIKDHDINSAGQCDESVSGHYIASFRAEEKKLKNAGSFSTFTGTVTTITNGSIPGPLINGPLNPSDPQCKRALTVYACSPTLTVKLVG